MVVTKFTKSALASRRFAREAIKDGWEKVDFSGGPLWSMHNGARWREKIRDVKIDISGDFIWVKIS